MRDLRNRARLFASAFLLAFVSFVCGCATAPPSRIRELAASGAAYGTALDALIVATEETAVDASSARALSEGRGVKTAAVRTRILEGQDKLLEPVLEDLEKLRRHARLLKRYFESLGDLAGNSTDESVAKAVAGSAEALEKLGRELGSSASLSSEQKEILARAASLVVQGVRDRAIAAELTARAAVIDRQLELHHQLLLALRNKLKADARSLYDLGYPRDVKTPYETDEIKDAKEWIALRRSYVLMDRRIDALEKASDASSRLRAAWKAYVENKFDAAALADALKQVDSAVALAEAGK